MNKKTRPFFIISLLFMSIFLLLLFVNPLTARMYKWEDKNGVIHFSDDPPSKADADIKILPKYNTNVKYGDVQDRTGSGKSTFGSAQTHSPSQNKTQPKVELYVTSWCGYCKKAKAFFRSRGISVMTYDIEKDKSAALRKAQLDNKRGIPFAVINGKKIHGYSEQAYLNALGK